MFFCENRASTSQILTIHRILEELGAKKKKKKKFQGNTFDCRFLQTPKKDGANSFRIGSPSR